MAVITLASASLSPGVTTSALAISFAWPRPVLLIEADPVGYSAVSAGYLRGWVPHNRGVIDLAVAHRQGRSLTEAIREVAIPLPTRQADAETPSSVRLVAGARSHGQATTIAGVWETLAQVLRSLERTGTDVIVDAGRLGMVASPTALLRSADLTLLTTRATLPALMAANGWARQLRSEHETTGRAGNLGLLLVGEGRKYSQREVREVLKLPVIATLPLDPVSSEVYHLGAASRRRHFENSPLPRAAAAAAAAIDAVIDDNRRALDAG